MHRLRPLHSALIVAAALASWSAPAITQPQPRSELEHYSDLLWLRGESFRCLRASPPHTPGEARRDDRMRDRTSRMQAEIRSVLVQREGAEILESIERDFEEAFHGVYFVGGCNFAALERSRETFRRALQAMKRRLGLPVGSRHLEAD